MLIRVCNGCGFSLENKSYYTVMCEPIRTPNDITPGTFFKEMQVDLCEGCYKKMFINKDTRVVK